MSVSDLVQRLRDAATAERMTDCPVIDALLDRAADEITRLRAALMAAHEEADDHLEDLQLCGYHDKIWYPKAVFLVRNLTLALDGVTDE